jgi:peptide/nickel transport system substrate-binding protein
VKTFAANDNSFYDFNLPHNKAQAAFLTAVPAYPSASEFIQFQFSCGWISTAASWGPNMSKFCSPRLDATMHRAFAAEEAGSPAWAGLWASADRQVTNAAPLVALANPRELDFVSKRVGNYQFNPVQGPLLDQLWVH